jgi:hypothetical protein
MTKNGGVFNYAINRWLHELRKEVVGAQLTAMLAGVAAPFVRKLFPKAPTAKDGTGSTVRRLDLLGFKWPKLDNAIRWLTGQQILTDDELESMANDSIHATSHDFEALQAAINKQWQDELRESVRAGESREDWRARVEEFAPGMVDQAETIGRTFTHRAYNAGLQQITDKPVVAELFPYWLYECTADSRSRASHVAMNQKVAHRDSPLAGQMQVLIDEYNCRCTMIPLDREDALAKGIDDDTGWVEPTE